MYQLGPLFLRQRKVAGSCQQIALDIEQRDRALDQLGQRVSDLARAATAQHDGRESLVDRHGAGKSQSLLIENETEDGVEQRQ